MVIVMGEKEYTCCFFGHRKINITDELIYLLKIIVKELITEEKIDTFLFGSKSLFDKICLRVVTELKNEYPHIKRIYVRAEYPYIDEDYEAYLLKNYDHTYYPKRIINAGRASYVERNQEMIDKSNYCVVYYDENYMVPVRKNNKRGIVDCQSKSGTKFAYNYAIKKGLIIENVFEKINY